MKHIWAVLILLSLSACATLNDEPLSANNPAPVNAQAIGQLHKAKIGMSAQEIEALLGDKLIIGYDINPTEPKERKAITLAQPYRREQLQGKAKTYDIAYYFSSISKADGMITEEELTPLIFNEGRLIGKGAKDLQRVRLK